MARKGLWTLTLVLLVMFLAVVGLTLWLVAPGMDLWPRPNRIAVLNIKGMISEAEDTLAELKKFRQDANVRAILIRIDSPGGSVAPSQEIYREIRKTISTKPVVASLASVAASGGYYIACAASRIVADPGTITGSIGVLVNFPNLKGLFDKIGYKTITLKSGPYKDSGNPGREMTEAERKVIQQTVNQIYRQFVRDVAKGRRLPLEDVEKIADGRILSGETALKLGLIDELGNFEDAVQSAARLGNIVGEPKLVYAEKKRRSVLQWLLGRSAVERLQSRLDTWISPIRYEAVLGP